MARKQKLKVYRTPIGFHDAYVAAPSQKAALDAWGADADLFARGVAETVNDEALTREPLEQPGVVVRKLRGTADEQMAALPRDRPRAKRRTPPPDEDEGPPPRARHGGRRTTAVPRRSPLLSASEAKPARASPPKAAPKRKAPRPSRVKLDEAERAIEQAEAEHARRVADLRDREKQIQQERRAAEAAHAANIAKLEGALTKVRDRYTAALQKWRA